MPDAAAIGGERRIRRSETFGERRILDGRRRMLRAGRDGLGQRTALPRPEFVVEGKACQALGQLTRRRRDGTERVIHPGQLDPSPALQRWQKLLAEVRRRQAAEDRPPVPEDDAPPDPAA